MGDKPTFVLLSQRLPADTLAHNFLGRIVENVKYPTFGFRPEDSSPLFTESPIEVSDTDASIYHEANREGSAKGELSRLFGLSVRETEEEKASLKGKTIVTRLLLQHRDVFKNIMKLHEESITEFVEENDSVGYMVVGLKNIFNGTMERAFQKFRHLNADVSLPIGTAVWAASSGALNLGSAVDPKAEFGKHSTAKWAAFSQIEDEQIFAVQYRIIELSEGLISCWGKPKLKIGGVMEFQDGVFGEGEHSRFQKKAVLEEDDEEHSSDNDEGELVLSDKSLRDEEFDFLGLTFVS